MSLVRATEDELVNGRVIASLRFYSACSEDVIRFQHSIRCLASAILSMFRQMCAYTCRQSFTHFSALSLIYLSYIHGHPLRLCTVVNVLSAESCSVHILFSGVSSAFYNWSADRSGSQLKLTPGDVKLTDAIVCHCLSQMDRQTDIPLISLLQYVFHAQQHVRDKIKPCNNAIALILDMLSVEKKKGIDRQGIAE